MTLSFDLSRLATVQLVPPTPFTADGQQVVPEVLTEHCRRMAAAGIRVFIPAAGTGEFHSLSVDEVLACVRATRQALGPESLVIAPIGLGLNHALAIGRQAFEAGADALLLMPPVHPYLSDDGFRDYFVALTDALPLPILAYKKGDTPSDALLLELARSGRLAGVKYAVNDLNAFGQFAAAAPPDLGVYCGTAERFAPYFALAGARGFTSGAANLSPQLAVALQRHLLNREYVHAMHLLQQIRPIEDFRARHAESFNISAVKAGLASQGFNFGPPRPPQRRLTTDLERDLATVLAPVFLAERDLASR